MLLTHDELVGIRSESLEKKGREGANEFLRMLLSMVCSDEPLFLWSHGPLIAVEIGLISQEVLGNKITISTHSPLNVF